MLNRSGARIGAVAFAVGLSLAGPQAMASAEVAEGETAPASAGNDVTQRQAAVETRRSARSAGAATARPVRTPHRSGPLATASTSRPVHIAKQAAAATGRAVTRVPSNPSPAADPARVLSPRPAPAPVATASLAPPATLAAARPPEALITAIVHVARAFDLAENWLSGLPASPITDFLSGALLALRRNLFPSVPTIPGVSVATAVVDEGALQAVFTVSLDKAYTSTVTVGYATNESLAASGAESADIAGHATAGADYHAASGVLTFAPGQTSQQFSIAIVADQLTEISESFGVEILATWSPAAASSVANGVAAATAVEQLTSVVLAAATATIVDDDRVKIDVNPNFAYGDALLASVFSDLAYNHRDAAEFSRQVLATGWQGIGISPAPGSNGFSPDAGGYGVRDGLSLQSYAFAGRRTAADGTVQFVVSFEGSNSPFSEPADWIANVGEYGWSRYYASLEPLMAEVVRQMLGAQQDGGQTQLILTGHSLGGATAMMAFADLLVPQGNLWPDTGDVLAAGDRILDLVGGWSPETRTALLAATSVYTFGAPSILIEPTKLGLAESLAFGATVAGSGLLGALTLLPRTVGALTVNDTKLPDLTGIAGINFGTRVFQFEHANTSWIPPYPGDIVAQIGSRDPGTVLQINLDNDIQVAYTSLLTRLLPGGTHPIAGYRESVIRLITNRRVLKNPNTLADTSPQLPQTTGSGSDTRNDFFVNAGGDGRNGNDLFTFSQGGTYSANGGAGSDAYSIGAYGVSVVIDGANQSGRDTVLFDLVGTPGASYYNSGSGDTAVFSVTGSGGESSSVTVTHWDKWQVSDVMQVIKPADGRWSLDMWTDIERGPIVSVGPANEIPLSVL